MINQIKLKYIKTGKDWNISKYPAKIFTTKVEKPLVILRKYSFLFCFVRKSNKVVNDLKSKLQMTEKKLQDVVDQYEKDKVNKIKVLDKLVLYLQRIEIG